MIVMGAGVVVLVAPWVALVALRGEFGAGYVLFLLLLIWVADIGAYFAGRRWGRRKLAQAISPGKTWEGVLGRGGSGPGVCSHRRGDAGRGRALALVRGGLYGDDGFLHRGGSVREHDEAAMRVEGQRFAAARSRRRAGSGRQPDCGRAGISAGPLRDAGMSGRIGVTILGSTGSIGVSTLDVLQRHADRFRVVALTANRDVEGLFQQC
jgi:hypothetical protein